jgi:glycosyltransferase involved in cell wall biosynthesis
VVQRYGTQVSGGAELHCRWLAERLARRHEVEVFTTRALDYVDWRDSYPPGSTSVNGVRVHRFGVRRRRNLRTFASLSELVFHQDHTREDEERWFQANGPDAPSLVEAVSEARERFDFFLFYSYRYYHSYRGVRAVPERAVLVPTAEEDPAIDLAATKELFRLPRGIVYLTPEEQALVEGASGGRVVPSVVIGSGVNLAEPSGTSFSGPGSRPYILYLGRIDKNKGCATLFAYFRKFIEETGRDVDLVLAGQPVIPIPSHPRIRHVGVLTEEEKAAALQGCRLLVMPSPFESLSIVVLEAWKCGLPVLVNGRCKVLAGQCERANGGLYYGGYAEFAAELELLLSRPEIGHVLGRQGREYVERECTWERVESKLEGFLTGLGS